MAWNIERSVAQALAIDHHYFHDELQKHSPFRSGRYFDRAIHTRRSGQGWNLQHHNPGAAELKDSLSRLCRRDSYRRRIHSSGLSPGIAGPESRHPRLGILAQAEQYKLIDAAVEAGVRRFIPSDWGMDNGDPKNQQLCPVFRGKGEVEQYLRSKESEAYS